MSKFAMACAMKKRGQKMAEGGMMTKDGYQSECDEHCNHPGMPHPQASGYEAMPMEHEKHDHMAMEQDDKMLNQHGDEEMGPEGRHMAKGGPVDFMPSHKKPAYEDDPTELAHGGRVMPMHGEQSMSHEEDMVGRIMKKRQHMYSKGGMVANDTPPEADFDENEFDDLVKDDHLEGHNTGADEGDELGDEYDADHDDMVAKVMMKRRKQRNPNPA